MRLKNNTMKGVVFAMIKKYLLVSYVMNFSPNIF